MSVILLANVGNSDLEVDSKDLPPRHQMSPRELGNEVLQNYEKYRANINLSLLMPTLEFIAKREGVTISDIKLYLFASNQPQDITNPSDWQKDTAPIADVIQKYLIEKGMPKKLITIYHIEGSPADYSNALDFHFKTLKKIQAREGIDAHYYMEVSGGTPAMTAMLILMGAEVLGQSVSTLYLNRNSQEPYFIDVAQVLFARKTREALCNQINLYAYATALNTLDYNGSLIIHDERIRNLVKRLLGYADRRLAFDYERAREELREAHATGEMQAKLRFWQNELREKDSAKIIAELINSAVIKLSLGEYADFTQRLFRFQEATFRYLAEQMGIQYGKSEQFLSQSWLTSNSGLDNYLKTYNRDHKGNLTSGVVPVDAERSLNRYSLGAIVEYFVTHDIQWGHLQSALENLFALSSVADLRNKGIAGHGFEGVSKADIESSYQSSVDDLIQNIKEIYHDVFGNNVQENPYDALNRLIISLIEVNA